MSVEFAKLIRQDIGVRHDIIDSTPPKLFLHLHNVVTESVFPGYFITLRKMIDSLVFVEAFI